MKFHIKKSYNLDLLNFLNIMTGDEFYTKYHSKAYSRFRDCLSIVSKENINKLIELNEGTMLSPSICLMISSVPDFENVKLQELILDTELIKSYYRHTVYFDEANWSIAEKFATALVPILDDLEKAGFYSYWEGEIVPKLDAEISELDEYLLNYDIGDEIDFMLGSKSIDEITLYLCGFVSPHGIKICGNCYISDVTFPKETTLLVAIHEMFHPPYNAENLREELKKIAEEPFFQHAFETKNPQFGYNEVNSFIEENVVEALGLFIGENIGIMKDSVGYLKRHDEGSHVFSMLLMKYLRLYKKVREQSFEEYFKELVKQLPFGSFREEYEEIIQHKY